MQVVIPMSGAGSRFARAGYRDPKPLIAVDGRPLIEHVIEMFPGVTDFVFVCSRNHLETTCLESVLRRNVPAAKILAIEPHKFGPVYATMQAEHLIQRDEEVIVNYCDFSVRWDFKDFCRTMQEHRPAGALTAYRGFHPHTLGPNLYAYMRHDNRRLLEIREKTCFTNDRMNEFASSGTYYFRRGSLLVHYYGEAMKRNLSTNGEYYASMPYNLMVEDGEPVYIYELEKFLQWGTPEDLEEYQSWSKYFAQSASWQPTRPMRRGSVLIPMAGDGARFAREGYSNPKPLVAVADVPMIDRVLRTLPRAHRTVNICRTEHLQVSNLESTLYDSGRRPRVISLDYRTEGQACTCLTAESAIEQDEPVLVAPCDSSLIYDETEFSRMTADGGPDCIAFTFRNHPHANRNPRQYGWIETDCSNSTNPDVAMRVLCKQAPAGPVTEARGVTGMFWFRQSRVMFQAIRDLVARNERVNGEFYLDSVLGILIESGKVVRTLDVDHYICYGTPDDVRTFEYWESCFHKTQSHPYKRSRVKEEYSHAGERALIDCAAVL